MPLTEDELNAISERVLNINISSRLADHDAMRAVFFAHAETDVLKLLSEVRRLRLIQRHLGEAVQRATEYRAQHGDPIDALVSLLSGVMDNPERFSYPELLERYFPGDKEEAEDEPGDTDTTVVSGLASYLVMIDREE